MIGVVRYCIIRIHIVPNYSIYLLFVSTLAQHPFPRSTVTNSLVAQKWVMGKVFACFYVIYVCNHLLCSRIIFLSYKQIFIRKICNM
jgi:hypothetical protein